MTRRMCVFVDVTKTRRTSGLSDDVINMHESHQYYCSCFNGGGVANHMERSRTHIATGSVIGWDVGRNTRVVCCCGQQVAHITAGNVTKFLFANES